MDDCHRFLIETKLFKTHLIETQLIINPNISIDRKNSYTLTI